MLRLVYVNPEGVPLGFGMRAGATPSLVPLPVVVGLDMAGDVESVMHFGGILTL